MLSIFHKLAGTRTYVGEGTPMPIRDSEILAWSRLRDEPLSQVDLLMLDLLDDTWLRVMRSKGAEIDG